jgi:hypothetical protein
VEKVLSTRRAEQNLTLGIVGGVIGLIVGAVLWAIITVVTDYKIGYMALGVGFLVGAGVRFLGKGIEPRFGYVGGGLALIGCLLGNFLTVLIVISREFNIPFLTLLTRLNLDLIVESMKVTFRPMDLLFYALAIYAGYRYSFR